MQSIRGIIYMRRDIEICLKGTIKLILFIYHTKCETDKQAYLIMA